MELPTIENQKKLLKELYKKYLMDIKKTTEHFNGETMLKLSVGVVENFINKNKAYFSINKNIIEQLKLQQIENKLFQLAQSGNMKSIELYLRRVDEKKSDKSTDIQIKLTIPKDLSDAKPLLPISESNKVESSREINDKRAENETI